MRIVRIHRLAPIGHGVLLLTALLTAQLGCDSDPSTQSGAGSDTTIVSDSSSDPVTDPTATDELDAPDDSVEVDPTDSDDLEGAETILSDPDSEELTDELSEPEVDLPEPRPSADECLSEGFVDAPPIGPDYDQFEPVVGYHCLGTDHQDVQDIERVVFLGDSVTAGTPPSLTDQYYRTILADRLAERFELEAPSDSWRLVNVIDNGKSLEPFSGDFANCAEWGARTDDLMRDSTQVEDCFPSNERGKTTLVIFTIGGNDIASITKAGLDGDPLEQIWEENREFVALLDDTIAWLVEPGRFPAGVHVIFSNMFEFTDGTGETTACPAASLAGFGAEWENPDDLADLVIWANEQYLRIAVDYGVDMIFMLEAFCGHGFNNNDPRGPCYRGPRTPTWFDLTCIHPNPEGHQQIADMFMTVVDN